MSTLFRPEVLATTILAVSLMFIGSPQVQPVNATAAFAAQSNVFANAAYVFVEPTGGWGGLLTENQKLSAAPGAAASPIDVLALSSDTLVMGAPNEDPGRFRRQGVAAGTSGTPGLAYIYMRDHAAVAR